MDSIKKIARAKVNIALDVLGKRKNGYHDVSMIMHTIELFDELSFQKNKTGKATMQSSDPTIPEDERNLIIKAANLFMKSYGICEGVHISLEKRIPHAAGLGGGSADAAETFLALNELFEVHASIEELMNLGVNIGADVPFCILGGTALAEGIGEILTKVPALPSCKIVLVKPSTAVSTAEVYRAYDEVKDVKHPNILEMMAALKEQDLKKICASMGNVLEEVTIHKYPELKLYKEEMIKHGALGAMMSGSGPTIFGIFDQEKKALEAVSFFENLTGIEKVVIT